MRVVGLILTIFPVIVLAWWAYRENYETRKTIKQVVELEYAIGRNRELLGRLRAEWAHLNRPERLEALVELNFTELRLMPVTRDRFGSAFGVPFAFSESPEPDIASEPQSTDLVIEDRTQ